MTSKLKILVPVKRTIDAAIRPRVNSAHTGIETTGLKYAINPFCEIALEEAARLKEKLGDRVESVSAASIGPKKSQDVLRLALAKGADTATLVETAEGQEIESLAVAKILAGLVNKNGFNLVLLGKQAIDNDANQTGQMLAGLLGWPQATFASKVEINGDEVQVEREVDGGSEVVKASLPLVITADLRLNEPRYAKLPDIMKAKRKPLETIPVADTGVDVTPRLKVLSVQEPPARAPGVKVPDVNGLLSALKEKGAL